MLSFTRPPKSDQKSALSPCHLSQLAYRTHTRRVWSLTTTCLDHAKYSQMSAPVSKNHSPMLRQERGSACIVLARATPNRPKSQTTVPVNRARAGICRALTRRTSGRWLKGLTMAVTGVCGHWVEPRNDQCMVMDRNSFDICDLINK